MYDAPALPDGLPLEPAPDKAVLIELNQTVDYEVGPEDFDCFPDDACVILAEAVLLNKHGIEIRLTAWTTPEALRHLRVGDSYRTGQGAKRVWRQRAWDGVIDGLPVCPGGLRPLPNHTVS